MNNEPVAYENTDKEIWREIPDDYYAPSIFVTAQNTIGINVGGSVHVKHVHEWHRLAHPVKEQLTDEEWLITYQTWALTSNDPLVLKQAILRKASEQ